jgi:hypothetical protein
MMPSTLCGSSNADTTGRHEQGLPLPCRGGQCEHQPGAEVPCPIVSREHLRRCTVCLMSVVNVPAPGTAQRQRLRDTLRIRSGSDHGPRRRRRQRRPCPRNGGLSCSSRGGTAVRSETTRRVTRCAVHLRVGYTLRGGVCSERLLPRVSAGGTSLRNHCICSGDGRRRGDRSARPGPVTGGIAMVGGAGLDGGGRLGLRAGHRPPARGNDVSTSRGRDQIHPPAGQRQRPPPGIRHAGACIAATTSTRPVVNGALVVERPPADGDELVPNGPSGAPNAGPLWAPLRDARDAAPKLVDAGAVVPVHRYAPSDAG